MSDDDEESTSGSQSTLFGSVKSSKSSASFFGSCKSTGLYKEDLFKFFIFSIYIFKLYFCQTRSEVFIQLIRQVTKAMLLEEAVLEQRFLVHVKVQVK